MNYPLNQTPLRLALAVFSIISLASCASAQDYSGYDLSTVEGVNAAREAKLGRPLDSHSKGCVSIPKQLPGIVLIGSFAFDRGCGFDEAIIQKRGVPDGKELSTIALESLGWKSAVGEQRKELALRWVQYGLLAFENPLTHATKDFKPDTFQMPRADLHEDGSVTVSLWVQRPSGMRCESAYDKFRYKFLQDGSLVDRARENSFSIPCRSGN